MPGNFRKDDLRILKTCKALSSALFTLLSRQRFSKLTVNDVCAEAMVSRAAFYSHYRDKYDLLEQSLDEVSGRSISRTDEPKLQFEQTKRFFTFVLLERSAVIGNLIGDSDRELQSLLMRYAARIFNITGKSADPILIEFISGGLMNVALEHIGGARTLSAERIPLVVDCLLNLTQSVLDLDIRIVVSPGS